MKYRRRVEVVDAEQYNGINGAEMVAFAPTYLETTVEGVLMQKGHPTPLEPTEWVYKDIQTRCYRMSDAIFQQTWQPGGAPTQ